MTEEQDLTEQDKLFGNAMSTVVDNIIRGDIDVDADTQYAGVFTHDAVYGCSSFPKTTRHGVLLNLAGTWAASIVAPERRNASNICGYVWAWLNQEPDERWGPHGSIWVRTCDDTGYIGLLVYPMDPEFKHWWVTGQVLPEDLGGATMLEAISIAKSLAEIPTADG